MSVKPINFICHLATETLLHNIVAVSNAAHHYQHKVIKAISFEQVLSIMPLPCIGQIDTTTTTDEKNIQYFNGRNTSSKIKKLYFDTVDLLRLVPRSSINVYYSLNIQTLGVLYYSKWWLGCQNYIIIADYEIVQAYKNPFRKALQMLINASFRVADGVLVLSENIQVHRNTQVLAALVDEASLPQTLPPVLPKSILFSGSIGIGTGIEVAMQAMDFLPEHTLFITGKCYFYTPQQLETQIAKSKYGNIRYMGNIAYENYIALLQNSEYALSLRSDGTNEHQFNFPSKIVEYLSFNKKVISSLRYAALEEGIIFQTAFEATALAAVIDSLVDTPQPNTQQYVTAQFGLSKFKTTLQRLIEAGSK